MKEKEANKLRDIANELDDYSCDIAHRDGYNKLAQMLHWGANEIRRVIMDGGFHGFVDAKYDTTMTTRKFNNE